MNVQPLMLNAMIPADGGSGHGVTIKKAAPCESPLSMVSTPSNAAPILGILEKEGTPSNTWETVM